MNSASSDLQSVQSKQVTSQSSKKAMNNNSTAVNSTHHSQCSTIVYEIYSFVQPAFSLVSFLGNFLVIVCVYRTPGLRNSINLYIVNMAISDLLYIFISGPMFRIKSLVDVSTSTGMLLCRILHPTKIVAHFVSIESLVLIAADRYIATVKPFKAKKVTTRTRAVLISLSWLLAALVLVPLAYHSKYPTIRNIVFCSPIWTDAAVTIYGRVLLTMYYCVPLAVITVLYSRITRTLKRRPPGNNLQGGANLRRLKEQRKIMTILVSIVSAFFVCWTPFAIFATGYLSVSLTSFKRFSKHTCYVINIVAYRFCPLLSTAINPTILFTLGTKYRKALTNLFSCFVGKLRPRSRRIVHEEPAC